MRAISAMTWEPPSSLTQQLHTFLSTTATGHMELTTWMLMMMTSSRIHVVVIFGANDHKGNRYITLERSPHDHVEFDYAAPYKTSQ